MGLWSNCLPTIHELLTWIQYTDPSKANKIIPMYSCVSTLDGALLSILLTLAHMVMVEELFFGGHCG